MIFPFFQPFFDLILLLSSLSLFPPYNIYSLVSQLPNDFANLVSLSNIDNFYYHLIISGNSSNGYDLVILSTISLSILSGIAVGFSLGLIGGGGSILAVPLLVYAIGMEVHMAIGTSALAVSANALINLIYRFGKGCIMIKEGILFAIPGALGAIFGAQLGLLTSPQNLMILFALFMVIISSWMIMKSKKKTTIATIDDKIKERKPQQSIATIDKNNNLNICNIFQKDNKITFRKNLCNIAIKLSLLTSKYWTSKVNTGDTVLKSKLMQYFKRNYINNKNGFSIRGINGSAGILIKGLFVGIVAGYFGIGGGFLIVPAIMHAIPGITIIESIATSLIPVSIFGFTTSIKYVSAGQINWLVAILFIIGGAIGGIIGTKLTYKIPKEKLITTFAILLIVVAFYIVFKTAFHF